MRREVVDLSAWELVGDGELVEFPSQDVRRCRVSVNSSAEVVARVYSEAHPDGVIVGSGKGRFDLRWTSEGDCELGFDGAGAEVWVRRYGVSHEMPKTSEAVFTSVLPRSRRNSEYDRMVMLMRVNEQRREAKLRSEIAAIREAARERGISPEVAELIKRGRAPESQADELERAKQERDAERTVGRDQAERPGRAKSDGEEDRPGVSGA